MRGTVSIGDFSRMTHLTVKTLRHYHDVGLLAPAETDKMTGYRCYAKSQVPVAQVIRPRWPFPSRIPWRRGSGA